MSFYDDMALAAKDIIAGFKTGDVKLYRRTTAAPAPELPWNPALQAYEVYDLEAVVMGVTEKYLLDSQVKASDLLLSTSPFFKLNGQEVQIEPGMDDEISIGGTHKSIVKIERVPATGTASAFFIVLKS